VLQIVSNRPANGGSAVGGMVSKIFKNKILVFSDMLVLQQTNTQLVVCSAPQKIQTMTRVVELKKLFFSQLFPSL
jgi:hypothetical protein